MLTCQPPTRFVLSLSKDGNRTDVTKTPVPDPGPKPKGFTLLEVLVALVIVTLTLTGAMQVFSGGLRNAVAAQSYLDALSRAESEMARLGTELPLTPGRTSGRYTDGVRWERSIRQTTRGRGLTAYEATVRVSFDDDRRTVSLTTLKLKDGF